MRTAPKHFTSFDTHQVIKRLMAKGIEEPQAEEIVHVIIEGSNADLSQLATKEQLLDFQNELMDIKSNLRAISNEITIKASTLDVAKTKTQLFIWIFVLFLISFYFTWFVLLLSYKK